jgi:nucleotide-binding universal stress UspA family protein
VLLTLTTTHNPARDPETAIATVRAHLDRIAGRGIAASGLVLHSVGDHATAGEVLAAHAGEVGAQLIALGRSPRGALIQFADGSITAAIVRSAQAPVVLLVPGKDAQPLSEESLR